MPRILFVDDEQDILDSLRAMLRKKRREWKMNFADSGEKALEILTEKKVDIIISDIMMPVMDGATLLQKVKKEHPHWIRIVLSGQADETQVLKLVRVAHTFLSKPCEGAELIDNINRVLRLKPLLQNPEIENRLNKIEHLPTLPDNYLKLMELLQKPDSSMEEISALVANDFSVSSTVLKLVNSAFFGFFGTIKDPHRAVPLLGISLLQGLFLGVHIISVFDGKEFNEFSLDNLWKHSMNTALIAREIAKSEGLSEDDIETSFVAGLLHDIGKLIFAQEYPEEYRQVIERLRNEDTYLQQAELDQFQVSHAEIGAYLLGIWHLDEEVVLAVANHHAFRMEEEGFRPSHCVNIANYLEHTLLVYNENYTFSPLCTEQLKKLGKETEMEKWKELVTPILEVDNG